MKKLFTKGFYMGLVIILCVGVSLSARAQYVSSNLETGGLYTALAKDANNNLYVTRVTPASGPGTTYEVEKYTNGKGAPAVIYTGLTHETGDYPWGLTVTSTGNVYISTDFTSSAGAIIKLTYNGGTNTYVSSTFQTGRYFTALAVDAGDNLYDTEYDGFHTTYAVVKYAANSAANSAGTNLYDNLKSGMGYAYPTGLAIASNGDIYVADAFSNTFTITDGGHVYKLTKASAYAATLVSTGQYSSALALDAADNLYSSENSGTGYKLVKYTNGTGTPSTVFSPLHTNGIYYPWGIAIISATDIFVADGDDGTHGGAVIQWAIPPPPAISYSSPQLYNANTAITPLAPTSTGVAAAGYGATPVSVSSGFSSPTGVAADAAGNIYVADEGHKLVKKIPVGGGAPITLGSGFTTPYGVAVDAAGNVYVADYGSNLVKEIPVGGGAPVTIGSGFLTPTDVAVDAAGNVYVADFGNNAVKKIPAGNGTPVTVGSGFNHPAGISVDGLGNVFVADYGNSAVKEILAGGGSPVILGSGFLNPHGLAVDGTGNVFVADYGNSAVKEIFSNGGIPVTIGAGFSHPVNVATDGLGNVYVADLGNNAVKQIKPVGGYYINRSLPAGLSFSNATGTISGTPAATSPATTYTITAYNVNGVGTPATVNITVNIPLPTISYSSPQIYTTGTAITPLVPASTGVAAPAYNAVPVVIGSGFSSPTSVAADAAGNVYVADEGHKLVKEIPAGGGAPVNLGSGFVTPYGVASDAAGNVYVADFGNNTVKMIPVGSVPVSIGSGFSSPMSVAVDAAGNVYVADYGNNAVKKIPAGGGATVVIGSGFTHPAGVAVDGSGNVYVADYGNSAVKKIPAGGGAPVVIGSGFLTPHDVAVDAAGNIFVADFGNNAVKEIPAGGGNPITLGAGFSHPVGIAADGFGNVYIADLGNNAVKQIKPIGGYFIGPVLPAGLTFSNSTGTISGTPTAGSPATDYTITAYNAFGRNAATLNITVNVSPLPSVSYSGPQTYATGTAIAPLVPTSSQVAAPGYVPGAVTLGSGFSSPTGVAIDVAGNIYVADEGHAQVKKIPVGGGAPFMLGSGFVTPYGVAVDGAGNVYVADYGNSTVKQIPVGGGALITLGSGFLNPTSVAVDAAGNVYVADYGNNAVKKIPAGGGAPVILGSGFIHPAGVAVDGLGNVFVADASNGAIKKIPAGGGAPVILASGFSNPHGVAVDGTGNVFLSDYGNNAVKEIPTVGGAIVTVAIGFNHPLGIAVDAANNIYVADLSNNAVKEMKPSGGYYISPGLPAGLSFSNSTGVISGTPTASSPPTNYTITVYNSYGSRAAALNIKVNSNNARLANLALSNGQLTPAFAAGTTSYTASVSNNVVSVTVTPTTGDPGATVKVNGTAVTSGKASTGIALALGPNTITTVVTSQDGTTTGTYTITVTRNVNGNNSFYEPISVTKPADSPTITEDGIIVHQGISPNGDGINDVFTIDGLTNYPNNKVTIMNRNGAVVFQTQGYDNSTKVFDGHSNINGAMQLPGTYFYLLEYKVGNDVKHKTGFVILKY